MIALYVTLANWIFTNEALSIAVIISGAVSLYDILNRSNDEDMLLIQNASFKSLNFRSVLNFSVLYLLRVFWRFCDICSGILLLILFGLVTSVSTMLLYLAFSILFALIYPIIRLYFDGNLTWLIDNIAMFNILIQTPIAHNRSKHGIIATYYGLARIFGHICLLGILFYFDQILLPNDDYSENSFISLFIHDGSKTSANYPELEIIYFVSFGMFAMNSILYFLHFSVEFNVCKRVCFCCSCCCVFSRTRRFSVLAHKYSNKMREEGQEVDQQQDLVLLDSCDGAVGCGITGFVPRTLVSCRNMKDVHKLEAFEYAMAMSDVVNVETWINFDDPLELMKFVLVAENRRHIGKQWNDLIIKEHFGNFAAFGRIWIGIFSNPEMSKKGIKYWMKLLELGKFGKFKNNKRGKKESDAMLKCCIRNQSNPGIVAFFVEKYNAKTSTKLVRYAKKYNKTKNQDIIVTFLESGLKQV